jgi:pimeloyl-ACP methyl ester carboxylesterase
MLHGEPTWGYEWRHLIGPLARHHRVVVTDQMGFGNWLRQERDTAGSHVDDVREKYEAAEAEHDHGHS